MAKRKQTPERDPDTIFRPFIRREVTLEEAHEISKTGAMIEWHADHAFVREEGNG